MEKPFLVTCAVVIDPPCYIFVTRIRKLRDSFEVGAAAFESGASAHFFQGALILT
jgi:hypothetical protein